MKHLNRLSLLMAALLVSGGPAAHACDTVGRSGGPPVQIGREAAVIVWDAAHGQEHFVRRAQFATRAESFGFLVPTPSVPTLTTVDDSVFDLLFQQTAAKVVRQVRWLPNLFYPLEIGGGPSTDSSDVDSGSRPAARLTLGVTEIQHLRLGDFDASVLRSDDPAQLTSWLSVHGFAADGATRAWLTNYTGGTWALTAFKLDGAEGRRGRAELPAFRMSFATGRPFYPYREAMRAPQTSGEPRELQVCLLAGERMAGAPQEAAAERRWPGHVTWSDKLTPATLDATAKTLQLPADVLASANRMTVFRDTSSPRPAIGDLYFAPDGTQEAVLTPPHIIWEERFFPVPVAPVFIVVLCALWWRRRSR